MICNDLEVLEMFNECCCDLEELGYEVPYDLIKRIEFNNRIARCVGRCLTKSMTVGFGNNFKRPVEHVIQLNKCLRNVSYNAKKNIIMHEIIHTLYPYDGHGSAFRSVMNEVNNTYGYQVEIRNTNEEISNKNKQEKKYKLTCSKCGMVVYRYRKPSCTMLHSKDGGEMLVEKVA